MPSATDPKLGPKTPEDENRYSGPGSRRRISETTTEYSSGTNRSLAVNEKLPVPRKPLTCQVSSSVAWPIGNSIRRLNDSPSTCEIASSHVACLTPLAKFHLPLRRYPPSTRRAHPGWLRSPGPFARID